MLAIEHLSVEYYRGGKIIPAVNDVSLTIQKGESVGLVGESGSGKSTVALSILRLIRPQEGRIISGKIFFEGQDLLALPSEAMRETRGRQIAMIFQDPFTSLNPVLRIREQMEEVLTAHEGRGAKGERRTATPLATRHSLFGSLERVQLDPARALNAYPHQLSGGQRQRVMIAMALLTQPELILADEPTTALDVLVQKDILDLLFQLQRDTNVGMLFISHNLALVGQYTQRIAVMKEGAIVEEETPVHIFKNARHPYTRQLIAALPKI